MSTIIKQRGRWRAQVRRVGEKSISKTFSSKAEVDATAAIEAAAIATRAINESADVYAVANGMRADFIALAAEIVREAR